MPEWNPERYLRIFNQVEYARVEKEGIFHHVYAEKDEATGMPLLNPKNGRFIASELLDRNQYEADYSEELL
jgi:hypothetical protein